MFLFQLYDTHAPANVKTLLPLMVSAINLRAPQNARREHTALYQVRNEADYIFSPLACSALDTG